MRVTTGSLMRGYTTRLNSITRDLNTAHTRVASGRRFERAYEDPAAAVKSAQYRRDYLKNEDYMTNLRDVQSTFDAVESSMMNVSKIGEDAYADILMAVNGTNGQEERAIVSAKLRELQKSAVMNLNAQYGGQYVFGGSSTKEPPLELKDDGKLFFRGVDVTDGDQAALKKMADEKMYVDLGFGLAFDSGIKADSAYDMSTPAIKVMGYGKTADGLPKNMIVLLGEIANELEKPTYDTAKMDKMSKQLDVARNDVIVNLTQLGSNTSFLNYTSKRLEDSQYNFNVKMDALENMPPAQAITEFKMIEYSYMATLKMGSSILSPSFIDFMR